jgi:hypothetical protein
LSGGRSRGFAPLTTGSGTKGFFELYSDSISILDGADVSSKTYPIPIASRFFFQFFIIIILPKIQPTYILLQKRGIACFWRETQRLVANLFLNDRKKQF